MAQFEPFAENVEVNGQTVLSVITAISVGQDTRREILTRHGIHQPQPDKWYSQASWLEAFREIADTIGENTLFNIGKAIPENAVFPPEIDNLEKALAAIDIAYQMNHRGGAIGNYQLVSFDGPGRKAVMECRNPYPSEFDRGIITTMLRKFRPADSIAYGVVRDEQAPSRIHGDISCTYLIHW